MYHFCTPWKRQKIINFLTFLGDIEMEREAKMGQKKIETAWWMISGLPGMPKLVINLKIGLMTVFWTVMNTLKWKTKWLETKRKIFFLIIATLSKIFFCLGVTAFIWYA